MDLMEHSRCSGNVIYIYIYYIYIIYNKIGSTFFGEWHGLKPESEHDKHSQIINSALRSESKNPPFPGLKSLAWTAPGMPWFATWLAGPDFRHLFFWGNQVPHFGPQTWTIICSLGRGSLRKIWEILLAVQSELRIEGITICCIIQYVESEAGGSFDMIRWYGMNQWTSMK